MVSNSPSIGFSSSRTKYPRKAKRSGNEGSPSSSGSSEQLPTKKQRKPEPGGSSENPSRSSKAGKSGMTATTKQITTATTFGIEFEFVLAFHEKVFDAMKEDGIIIDVVKNHDHGKQYDLLSYEMESENRPYLGGQSLWPSWLLRVPDTDEAILNDAVRRTSQIEGDGKYIRRYIMEPLLVARQALADAGLNNVQVIGWTDKGHTRKHCLACASQTDVPLDHYTTKFGDYGNGVLLRSMVLDYDKWTLTNDYTTVPVRRRVLASRLVERGLERDLDSWDSYGLELITRVMRFDELELAFREIRGHLSALKGKRHVDAMESVWSTAHVHIGFDSNTKESLSHAFFQHVAFLLLSYERMITGCFPCRCSGAPRLMHDSSDDGCELYSGDQDLESQVRNLTDEEGMQDRHSRLAENELLVKRLEEEYTGDDDVRSNYEQMLKSIAHRATGGPFNPVTWQDVRDAIFTEEDNLVSLMQWMQMPNINGKPEGQRHRGYMVNWCNIYTIWTDLAGFKTFKPTLEFRQHNCSIDSGVIKHWVLLLQAVMVLARKKVVEDTKYGSFEPLDQNRTFAEREGSKYPNDGFPLGTVKAYVTQLLELNENEGLYWEKRYEKYTN